MMTVEEQKDTTVHIFSVASGHLYEKLLSIMMLSVRRHTHCKLHFWLIGSFFSPKFRTELLPLGSAIGPIPTEKYGCREVSQRCHMEFESGQTEVSPDPRQGCQRDLWRGVSLTDVPGVTEVSLQNS